MSAVLFVFVAASKVSIVQKRWDGWKRRDAILMAVSDFLNKYGDERKE